MKNNKMAAPVANNKYSSLLEFSTCSQIKQQIKQANELKNANQISINIEKGNLFFGINSFIFWQLFNFNFEEIQQTIAPLQTQQLTSPCPSFFLPSFLCFLTHTLIQFLWTYSILPVQSHGAIQLSSPESLQNPSCKQILHDKGTQPLQFGVKSFSDSVMLGI